MVALTFIIGLSVRRPRFLGVPVRSWASLLTLWTCLLTWKMGEVVIGLHELGGSFPALVVDLVALCPHFTGSKTEASCGRDSSLCSPSSVGGVWGSNCPPAVHCPVCSQRQCEPKACVLLLGQDGEHMGVSFPPSLPHLTAGSLGPGQPGRFHVGDGRAHLSLLCQ